VVAGLVAARFPVAGVRDVSFVRAFVTSSWALRWVSGRVAYSFAWAMSFCPCGLAAKAAAAAITAVRFFDICVASCRFLIFTVRRRRMIATAADAGSSGAGRRLPVGVHLVGLNGSLRAGSSNGVLLAEAARLAAPDQTLTGYPGVAGLPLFDEDLDTDDPPAPVRALRAQFGAAAGVLICTPEYVHGVPGGLKNTLDWLVGSSALAGKPTGLVVASSSGGPHALAALREILTTMGAVLPDGAVISIRGPRALVRGGTVDGEVGARLAGVLDALAAARDDALLPG
jgi:NAD(P)H-dependent FMN reductase